MKTSLVEENPIGNIKNISCIHCQKNTDHIIKYSLLKIDTESIDEFENIIQNFTRNLTVACCLCQEVSFVTEHYCSYIAYPGYDKNGNYTHDEYAITTEIYTPRLNQELNEKLKLNDLIHIPVKIRKTYLEIVNLLKNSDETNILANIGHRTLIEAIYNDKLNPNQLNCNKTIENKINELFFEKFISEYEKRILHKIRKNGNKSTHQTKESQIKTIVDELAVTIPIISQLYIDIPKKKCYFDTPKNVERAVDRL